MNTRDFAQSSPLASASRFAGGGGGHSQAFELLASFLTQFPPRARNNFIAILAALAFLFALLAFPAQAQTTVTIHAPSTIPEGGLVAQQVGNCPEMQRVTPTKRADETVAAFYTRYIAWYQANRYDRGYCEFRDIPDDALRAVPVTVKISNADAGQYQIVTEKAGSPGTDIKLLNTQRVRIELRPNFTQGQTQTLDIFVVSRHPNYTPGASTANAIVVLPPGATSFADAIARHEFTIVDDDNSAYIGQRRHHPYGETWNSQPHCYGVMNCAFD